MKSGARGSFRFRTADLIFLVYLESVTHTDKLEKFIVTKGNQALRGTVQINH